MLVMKASSSLANVTGSNEWDRQSSSTAGGTEMGRPDNHGGGGGAGGPEAPNQLL